MQKAQGSLAADRPAGFVPILEAARIADVTVGTINWWVKEGRLPAEAIQESGGDLWVKKAELRKALRKGRYRVKRWRDPDALSPNEAAEVLNVTGEAVKQWIYDGQLKATKQRNGYWRIKHDDLKTYLETRQNVVPMAYVATSDPRLAERILGVVRDLGQKAGSVSSTSDALKQFDQNAPNLLLVDLGNFPDAWKFIRKVRGTSYYGSPKILLLGNEPLGEKETTDAVRLGINGCLVEPVPDAVLRADVKLLLSNAGR